MKTIFIKSKYPILLWLFLSFQINAQISILPPKPAKNPNLSGSSPWTAICAGVNGFNQYYATISWVGNPYSNNEFILELSNANGDFSNPVELARTSTQNTNSLKTFDIEFSIPNNTRGAGYKMRVKSTSPADSEESANAYNMYYLDITQSLNISEDGSGVPPGDICSTSPITIQVDNILNPESYQYIWYRSGTLLTSENSHTLYVTESGVYQAYIDYGNICSGSSNTNSNIIDISIGTAGQGIAINSPENTSLCPGSEVIEILSIDVTNPDWNYQWYHNGSKIIGATASSYHLNTNSIGFEGDYQVEISGLGMCSELSTAITITNAASYTVSRENKANIMLLPNRTETLSVTTTALSPSYQWFRNSTPVIGANSSTLEITQEGNYYVEITQNESSCTNTVTKKSENTTVVFPTSFQIKTDYIAGYAPCESTSTVLGVSAIYAIDSLGYKTDVTEDLVDVVTYKWQKDGEDILSEISKNISLTTATENGDYTVTVSASTFQVKSNILSVKLFTSETIAITSTGLVYCNPDDQIILSTTTDLSSEIFSWQKDGISINATDSLLNITSSGKYRLVLRRGGCEVISNEVTISDFNSDVVQLDINGDIVFPQGGSKTVTANGASQYQWFDASNTLVSSSDSMTFTEEGSYVLIAKVNSCEIAMPINAIYQDTNSIPNVITPNGDGANDQWVVPNTYANKKDITVTIYNNEGVALLNKTDYQNNWPQSTQLFPKQNMVFYYVIKNASKVIKQGTITVII